MNATGDPTFKEYLDRVKRLVLEAHKHQIYPLTSLIKKLNLPRDPSRLPLVSVTFNLDVGTTFDLDTEQDEADSILPDREHAHSETLGLDVDVSMNAPGFVQWEISLSLLDSGRTLRAELEYNTDLFDNQTVRRWLKHYELLLRTVVSEPGARLSALGQRLEERDKQQLAQKKSKLEQGLKSFRRKPITRQPES